MSQPEKIVIHSAPLTRSSRIAWLLNELGLKFEVQLTEKSAPELKKIHPLGKLPLIEVFHKDGKKDVLMESGHIFLYFLRHFDTGKKVSGSTPEEQEKVDFFLHYSEGSLMPAILPSFVEHVAKFNPSDYNSKYDQPLAREALGYLELVLEEQQKNGLDYLVGKLVTAADMIIFLPVAIYRMLKIGEETPNVDKWFKNLTSQPNYVEATKATGEAGQTPW